MTQVNVELTPAMEKSLARYMRMRGFRSEAEAVRAAVEEGLNAVLERPRTPDFRTWVGLGKRSPNLSPPQFQSDGDLWD